jgi:hypothetical protein
MRNATELPEERIARNDAVFRDANERIRASAEAYDAETVPFLCECADLSCRTVILLDLSEYEAIRASGRRFLNAPGHEETHEGTGRVIVRRPSYVVFEKAARAGEVAEALDPRGAGSKDYERQQRLGRNEAIFRDVNERLTDLNETLAAFTEKMQVVCECGDGECIEQISMSPEEYEALRAESTHFAVVPGHDDAEVEEVVDTRDGYHVVRKRTGIPARIAEETDPRS